MNSNCFNVFMILILLLNSLSHAHKPIFTSQKGTDPNTAVIIKQPNISQVIYRELSDDSPQLWLTFDVTKDFQLFVQIGIPVIERLKYFRPAFAVLGPDLPSISLPFSKPNDVGGKAFTIVDTEPRFFHEHFTQTDSWILRSENITLPSEGQYYVVVYSPCKIKGKFWLSVGKQEQFTQDDWQNMGDWGKQIRKFHEVDQERANAITIDDFSDPNHLSKLGTNWRLITDRVMGGVSDGERLFGSDECFNYINMKGNVSLENNGGFVQVSLPLTDGATKLDATDYSGIRLWIKGNSEEYYIHLKNNKTRLPWQYYSADFTASENWKQVEIPFERFKPQALNDKLAVDSLTRIAIVGAKKAYEIDLNIGPIELYTRKDQTLNQD